MVPGMGSRDHYQEIVEESWASKVEPVSKLLVTLMNKFLMR